MWKGAYKIDIYLRLRTFGTWHRWLGDRRRHRFYCTFKIFNHFPCRSSPNRSNYFIGKTFHIDCSDSLLDSTVKPIWLSMLSTLIIYAQVMNVPWLNWMLLLTSNPNDKEVKHFNSIKSAFDVWNWNWQVTSMCHTSPRKPPPSIHGIHSVIAVGQWIIHVQVYAIISINSMFSSTRANPLSPSRYPKTNFR